MISRRRVLTERERLTGWGVGGAIISTRGVREGGTGNGDSGLSLPQPRTVKYMVSKVF